MRLLDELAPVVVEEYDTLFASGVPVTFGFVRNTDRSPDFGSRFQQDIEPGGRYLLHNPDPGDLARGWERGLVTFESPIVLAFNAPTDGKGVVYDETSWKARLHRIYGYRRSALSRALRRDGFDGIVTVVTSASGAPIDTREIVDLTGVVA